MNPNKNNRNQVSYFRLTDCCVKDNHVDMKVEQCPSGCVGIKIDGYGEKTSKDGQGMPILLDLENGDVRISIWDDINNEDIGKTISMKKALETNRKDLPPSLIAPLDSFDMVTIKEIARMALVNASFYEEVADSLDISDGYMKLLQMKLNKEGEGNG
jgi:hypothetical protein